jgi:hypothetical protein
MTTKRAESSHDRCNLQFADGRRCALPAAPQSNGLCYPHAHAPRRRLRASDLTRELASSHGAMIPAPKIRRLLAKLPIAVAVADDLISLRQAGIMTLLCNLMLGCNHQSRANPFHEPIAVDLNFIAPLLAEDDDKSTPETPPCTQSR